MSQECLATSGWSNNQDVAFLDFDIFHDNRGVKPFVMVIDSDGESFLCPVLFNHIIVKDCFNLFWSKVLLNVDCLFFSFFIDYFAAQSYAFIAYIDCGSRDQF